MFYQVTRPWLGIAKFRDLDWLPIQIDLSWLDEGDGLENSFVRWQARCHKSCYYLYEVETSGCWKVYTVSFACTSQQWRYMLFFGEYSTRNNPFHDVFTFGLDARVRKSATALQNGKLLAKLRAGDLYLVAPETKYHAPCLASLYKKAERVKEEGEEDVMGHVLDD